MSKFLLRASYLAEGVTELLRDGGNGRRSTIEGLIRSVGGTVEAFYYGLGDGDVYAIADFPDNATAIAVTASVDAAGAVDVTAVPVVTPEEIGEAKQMAVNPPAPGAESRALDEEPLAPDA
jgi:uncharacterized protein with GYD domain